MSSGVWLRLGVRRAPRADTWAALSPPGTGGGRVALAGLDPVATATATTDARRALACLAHGL